MYFRSENAFPPGKLGQVLKELDAEPIDARKVLTLEPGPDPRRLDFAKPGAEPLNAGPEGLTPKDAAAAFFVCASCRIA